MEGLQVGQTGRSPWTVDRLGYRIPDYCEAVGISRSSVYELIKNGKLQSVLIAGRRIIPADEARRLMREGS
jgi:predicted site-specific integrase-resolvase